LMASKTMQRRSSPRSNWPRPKSCSLMTPQRRRKPIGSVRCSKLLSHKKAPRRQSTTGCPHGARAAILPAECKLCTKSIQRVPSNTIRTIDSAFPSSPETRVGFRSYRSCNSVVNEKERNSIFPFLSFLSFRQEQQEMLRGFLVVVLFCVLSVVCANGKRELFKFFPPPPHTPNLIFYARHHVRDKV